MVEILMMSVKLAVLGLLLIKLILNKINDVCPMTSSNKTLSLDSNYIVDVIM